MKGYLYLFQRSPIRLWCILVMVTLSFSVNTFGQLPAGFVQKKLTGDVINEATTLAHAPDGRIFIGERSGTIKVLQNGVVSTVYTLATTTASEQGLLGITLHPQFATNGKCYVFYTNPQLTVHYLDVLVIGTNNQVTTTSRVMEFDPILNGFHNGGALLFKGAFLYIAIGESNTPAEATKLDTYRGKILRLTEDGQPAPGNPYYNEAGASRQKRSIWAIGMRNPWKMAIDPASQKIFVVNVGGNYEEINDVTAPDPAKNYNYGWDQTGKSGPEQATNTIQPVFAYGHQNWGCAITSGVFFNPPSTNYPQQYRNRFYFSDWCAQWYRSVDATNPGAGYQEFSTAGFGSTLGTSVGIDGNIYYVKYNSKGSIWRLEYANNQAPSIVNQPVSRTVVERDPVTFTVSASGGTPFTYQWQRNGTPIAGATAATYSMASVATTDAGNYRCVVTNASGSVTSQEASLTVTRFNANPVPHIRLPATSLTWSVGDVIQFSADATDPEDGVLPASSYKWEARFYHQESPTSQHWHPGPVLPTGVKSGSFVADNGGEESPNIWFRIRLTVTDSQGRIGVDSVDIQPNKVVLTADANVAGLQLILGSQATIPFSKTSVVNATLVLQAPSPQVVGNNSYVFTAWSHGGTASQSLRVPAVNTTYRATYSVSGSSQNPYLGSPVSLPGKIEAENFDLGGEGIAYHETSVGNAGKDYRPNEDVDLEKCSEGGFNVGYVSTGEWLEYTVNVQTASQYTLSARVATVYNGGSFHVELDGQPISGPVAVPNTGGYQAWQTVSVTTPLLTTGTKVVRIVMDAANINLNYITFAIAGSENNLAVTLTAPAANAVFAARSDVAISAATTGGTVSKVEFFQGTTKLGEDATAPYAFTWAGVIPGSYVLTAKATAQTGQSTVSTPISITVSPESVPGGSANLALKKPTVASSLEQQAFSKDAAVDGNLGTRWSSAFSDPQWIYVDLGASYSINQVKITWENAKARDYEIRVADVVGEWRSIKSIVNNAALVNDHTGLTARGRYVMIYGTARTTGYGYSIFELEVYGTSNAGARVALDSSPEERLYTIYPNPVDDVMTIDGLEQDGICTIHSVGTSNVIKIQSVNRTLDVHQLSTGMYVVEFTSANRVVRRKFLKR